MNLFRRIFRSAERRSEPSQQSSDVGHPIMPERTDRPLQAVHDVSAYEAAGMVESGEVQVLDVRFDHEYRHHRIPGAMLLSLPALADRYRELDPEKPLLVVCEHGMRSFQACSFLNSLGFKKLYNMLGGMSAYSGRQEGEGV